MPKLYCNKRSISRPRTMSSRLIPVITMILHPHFIEMEYKFRPGIISLTWTSLNITSFISHIRDGLRKVDQLVTTVNDIIENRTEKNLNVISKSLKLMAWMFVAANVDEMPRKRMLPDAKNLRRRLSENDFHTQLRKKVDDFKVFVALLKDLSKESIKSRHWDEVMKVCNVELDLICNAEFNLDSLIYIKI